MGEPCDRRGLHSHGSLATAGRPVGEATGDSHPVALPIRWLVSAGLRSRTDNEQLARETGQRCEIRSAGPIPGGPVYPLATSPWRTIEERGRGDDDPDRRECGWVGGPVRSEQGVDGSQMPRHRATVPPWIAQASRRISPTTAGSVPESDPHSSLGHIELTGRVIGLRSGPEPPHRRARGSTPTTTESGPRECAGADWGKPIQVIPPI